MGLIQPESSSSAQSKCQEVIQESRLSHNTQVLWWGRSLIKRKLGIAVRLHRGSIDPETSGTGRIMNFLSSMSS